MLIIVKYYCRVNFYALSLTCIVYCYQYGFTWKSKDCLGEPQGQSDTGVVVDGRPWIVHDGLGNFGVRGYSDTGVVVDGHPWIVQDGLGNFGVRGYSDTGVVMGGCPWIVQDGLGILGVQGYSDTGLVVDGYPWIVQDGLGILGHSCLDILGMSSVYRTWLLGLTRMVQNYPC